MLYRGRYEVECEIMNVEGNFCMIEKGFIEDSLKEKDFENGLILGNFWEIM